jgi:rhamnulokinase
LLRVAAVDLGATSVRVAVVDFDAPTPDVEIVQRYAHKPVRYHDGSLRWDWATLMAEVERGLEYALQGGPLASIGVDAWGVDYGLLDTRGALVAPPFSYRDARTADWRGVVDRLGERRLYETTGVQLMPINTVFQLAAHDRRELERAETLLMIPELVVHHLTGAVTAEVTSAGTTALVSLATGDWDAALIGELGVPAQLFEPIRMPGALAGEWRGVPVRLVGGHDTASAVAARPGARTTNRAFISTGTWVLVGVEAPSPVTSDAACAANFSNERSVDGGYRLLKNVTGLWLLERCVEVWGARSEAAPEPGPIVDPDDDRFVRAADIPAEIARAAGLPSDDRPAIVRCIFDSIAMSVARVIRELGAVTGVGVTEIDVFGGGAQIPDLIGAIEGSTGLAATVGSAEATALGNAVTQAVALGRRVR